MPHTFKLASILCIVFITGCSYNPGPNSVAPGKTMPGKAGSVYVYNNTPIDSNGHLLTDSAFMTVDSVAETGLTYNGRTNVTRFSIRNLKTGLITSSYINFESNGDISEYIGLSFLSFIGITYPDWATYPMQSHTSSGSKVADTTIQFPVPSLGTVPIHIIVMDSLVYINWSSYPIDNTSISVFNLKHGTHFGGTVALFIPINSDALTTVSFAPSLGYYCEKTTQPFHFPLGILPPTNGTEKKLVSYNLK